MSLQEERPKATYKCSQPELYAGLFMLCDSYVLNQVALFAKSTKYTVAFGTALRLAITGARNLPDAQARGAVPENLKILLEQKNDDACNIWQDLAGHIDNSFAEEFRKLRREEAGSLKYDQAAAKDWEVTSTMMESGSIFLTNHATELDSGGMPITFPDDFETIRGDFNNLHGLFKSEQQTAEEKTDTKILANNAIYTTGKELMSFAQKTFRNDPAIKERFIWSRILELVSGAGSTTITVLIPATESVSKTGVVANSDMVNISTVDVMICAGEDPCTIVAPNLLADETIQNTFGSVITITNPSTTDEVAKVTLRIVN